MPTYYVRLTPYDKKAGALCRRLTAGGMLFREGNWYEMNPAQAEKLRPLMQPTRAPYFEIVTGEAQWREIVRRELAAAMGGPQAAALAELFTQTPEKSPTPKRAGEVINSEFDGLRAAEVTPKAAAKAATKDLSPRPVAATLTPKAVEPAPEPAPEPEPPSEPAAETSKADKVDLSVMTKRELIELAEDLGLEIDPKARKHEILGAIKDSQ